MKDSSEQRIDIITSQDAPLKGMVHLDCAVIEKMKRLARGQTDQALNARFGIGYNTWRKIIAGSTIRLSVARRLMRRLDSIPD